MVCRFSRDGTILFVNHAYATTLETTPAALTGRNLWDFVSKADRNHVIEQMSRLSADNPQQIIENRFETVAGPRWTMWRNHALTFDADGNWQEAQSSGIDITDRKQLEEQRQLLIDELNHRVRNTLMVVQGMAYQSFKGDNMPLVPLETFNARLHALAAAHTAISRANWESAELAEIVNQGLAICSNDPRVNASGPSVGLKANAAVALALVLHELGTNAIKYGALSADDGRVKIDWQVDAAETGRTVRLDWRESNGPVVAPPQSKGFGSRLITDSIKRQLSGSVEMAFDPDGFRCSMAFPVPPSTGLGAA